MARVCLVVVARDDARRVERALLGARPYVSDMLVVDLGSFDDTAARAERLGARVITREWTSDPCVPRNAGLSSSGADWNVVLEPGEWIAAGGEHLLALQDEQPDRVGLVEVAPAGEDTDGVASLQPRVLPGHVRYGGRHRDEPIYPGLSTWRTGVTFGQDAEEPARWRLDRTRVEAVLLQACAVRPDDPRMKAQLAAVVRGQGRVQEAADLYLDALDDVGDDEAWRHALVVDTIDTLRQCRRFRTGLALVHSETPRWAHSPDFAFVVGDLFFEMMTADPAATPQLAPLAEASWKRCLTLGEHPELRGSMTGRGSFLAAQNLSVLNLTLGDDEAARRWWETADALRKEGGVGPSRRLLG